MYFSLILIEKKSFDINRRKLISSGKWAGKWADELTLVSQLGLTMAGSILFCFAIGYHLDKWLHTKGLFITLFILLGIAGGGYTVYRAIMKTLQQDEKKKTDHDQPKKRS